MNHEGPVILDAAATAAQLPFGALIDALATGFATGCEAPVRHHHTMAKSGEPDATLLLMPAWSHAHEAEQFLGVKLVTVVPGNGRRGLPALVSTYLLFDAVTGVQKAFIDGNTITGRRTVATSALAVRLLARQDARRLLVLGAGRIASLIPECFGAVRPIDEVQVWNVTPQSARDLAVQWRSQGIRATAVEDLEQAVRHADIVSAATLATAPLVRGEWLSPGTHVDLIGGFTPGMRECDDATMARSAIYIDTEEALHEAGDIVQPLHAKVIAEADVRGTLAALVQGHAPARVDDAQITCFKAVGSALADLVAARLVYANVQRGG